GAATRESASTGGSGGRHEGRRTRRGADRLHLRRRLTRHHGARANMPDTTRVVQDPSRLHPDRHAPAHGAGQGPEASPPTAVRTKLDRQQIAGFWAAWTGWLLDGMDSVIYALVLAPALTELLPRSGVRATPANIGFAGSILFAAFLVGWGLSFLWGPVADRFGRTRSLAATIVVYAVFTGAAALATDVWQLGIFRLLAGIGVGGEWAMAGTYVAEAWPEDRRKMGAGYL